MNPTLSIKELVNFLMVSGTEIVYVDGARSSGANELVKELVKLLPEAILYTPLGNRKDRCAIADDGAVVGGDAGLDIGQAHLGVLDFLEQCPVDQTVVIDRSPLSSLVFEPNDPSSTQEVRGFLERVNRAQLRVAFVLATCATDTFPTDRSAPLIVEQEKYLDLFSTWLASTEAPMHVFDAHRKWADARNGYTTTVHPVKLTTRWNYR